MLHYHLLLQWLQGIVTRGVAVSVRPPPEVRNTGLPSPNEVYSWLSVPLVPHITVHEPHPRYPQKVWRPREAAAGNFQTPSKKHHIFDLLTIKNDGRKFYSYTGKHWPILVSSILTTPKKCLFIYKSLYFSLSLC